MDEKKKFEINDDMLENVSGGVYEDTEYEFWKVGDKVTPTSGKCSQCGTLSPTATVKRVKFMSNWINMTIRMDCCDTTHCMESYFKFKRIR